MILRSLTLIGMVILADPSKGFAMLPEPGNIYYGTVSDYFGNKLLPESGVEVVMIRTEGTKEIVIARSAIISTTVAGASANYILRPVLDDGQVGRFSSSAGRKEDIVSLCVMQNGIRYPLTKPNQGSPPNDNIPVLGQSGDIKQVNFRFFDDLDEDGISDSWEFKYFWTVEFDGKLDFDRDERNNLTEFTEGTDPLLADGPGYMAAVPTNFQLQTILGDIVTLSWDSLPGKTYKVQWSGDLVGFDDVPAERFVAGDQKRINVLGYTRRFFRVAVLP